MVVLIDSCWCESNLLPKLAPDVLGRLIDYATNFLDDFNRPRQVAWYRTYHRGLIQDGDHKCVEPMAVRVPLPTGHNVADHDQALQQFLGQSPWDERSVLSWYRIAMAATFADPAAIFVIDDAISPQHGGHSVGSKANSSASSAYTAWRRRAITHSTWDSTSQGVGWAIGDARHPRGSDDR